MLIGPSLHRGVPALSASRHIETQRRRRGRREAAYISTRLRQLPLSALVAASARDLRPSARRAPAIMRAAGLWAVCLVFVFGAWAAVAGRAPAGVGATLPSPSDHRRVAGPNCPFGG